MVAQPWRWSSTWRAPSGTSAGQAPSTVGKKRGSPSCPVSRRTGPRPAPDQPTRQGQQIGGHGQTRGSRPPFRIGMVPSSPEAPRLLSNGASTTTFQAPNLYHHQPDRLINSAREAALGVPLQCLFASTGLVDLHPLQLTSSVLALARHGSPRCRERLADWHCQSSQPATQDCRQAWCRLHHHGMESLYDSLCSAVVVPGRASCPKLTSHDRFLTCATH